MITPDTKLRSLRDAEVVGKRVLVRVDFNVPIKDGRIVEDMRIRAAVPTIELLKQKGTTNITLMTHVGRPEGKEDASLRVAPLFKRLSELTDTTGVEMIENLRFDPREEANDDTLASELAKLGDIFVNDAFAVCHRAAASTVAITRHLPSYAGLLVEKEVMQLLQALQPPVHSLAIIGGAKFETKEPLIKKFLQSYENVLLGGALANDLLRARGMPIGASFVSDTPIPEELAGDERILMPDDVRAELEGSSRDAHTGDIRAQESIVDIGPQTARLWAKKITEASFIVWNGPMGVYEKGFTVGTDALAKALVDAKCKAVIGGGDTAAALSKHTFDTERIFISTGGGAMLEFLANGGSLPGIDVLKN